MNSKARNKSKASIVNFLLYFKSLRIGKNRKLRNKLKNQRKQEEINNPILKNIAANIPEEDNDIFNIEDKIANHLKSSHFDLSHPLDNYSEIVNNLFQGSALNSLSFLHPEFKDIFHREKIRDISPGKIAYYNSRNLPGEITQDEEEDESLGEYKMSGYHPVHVGEVMLNRYIILSKLGFGPSCTVWKALDAKYRSLVALKITKSGKGELDAAFDEVEILNTLGQHINDKEWARSVKEYWKDDKKEKWRAEVKRGSTQVLNLLNSFIYHGQNGKHFCLVYEIMGMPLSKLMKIYKNKGIPISYVKLITKQILIGLDYIHRICGVIHTDINPDNIWLCLSPRQKEKLEYLDSISSKKSQNIKRNRPKKLDEICSNFDGIRGSNKKKNSKDNTKSTNNINDNIYNYGMLHSYKNYRDLYCGGYENFIRELKSLKITVEEVVNYDSKELVKSKRPEILSAPKNRRKLSDEKEYNKQSEPKESENDILISNYEKSVKNYNNELEKLKTNFKYKAENVMNQVFSEFLTSSSLLSLRRALRIDVDAIELGFDAEKLRVKICHFSQACYSNRRLQRNIQRRAFRAPEVVLGIAYNDSCDLWSLACMVFEMITGDRLFTPRKKLNKFTKNDDHLAQFIEILGKIPKNFALVGTESKKYFTNDGKMLRISSFRKCGLYDVLTRKYHYNKKVASELTSFLLPMFSFYTEKRATAHEMLRHPWLEVKDEDEEDPFMSENEIEHLTESSGEEEEVGLGEGSESYDADGEDNSKYEEKDEDMFEVGSYKGNLDTYVDIDSCPDN